MRTCGHALTLHLRCGHHAPNASYARCDVTDESQIAAAVGLAVARHGRLDVLYSNAGVAGAAGLGRLRLRHGRQGANARSAVACLKHAAARVMAPRGGGCVRPLHVDSGSTTGILGGVAAMPYSLSKATVVSLVRVAAEEMAREGVRVNATSPHAIATPLLVRSLVRLNPAAVADDEQVKRLVQTGIFVNDGGHAISLAGTSKEKLSAYFFQKKLSAYHQINHQHWYLFKTYR